MKIIRRDNLEEQSNFVTSHSTDLMASIHRWKSSHSNIYFFTLENLCSNIYTINLFQLQLHKQGVNFDEICLKSINQNEKNDWTTYKITEYEHADDSFLS